MSHPDTVPPNDPTTMLILPLLTQTSWIEALCITLKHFQRTSNRCGNKLDRSTQTADKSSRSWLLPLSVSHRSKYVQVRHLGFKAANDPDSCHGCICAAAYF